MAEAELGVEPAGPDGVALEAIAEHVDEAHLAVGRGAVDRGHEHVPVVRRLHLADRLEADDVGRQVGQRFEHGASSMSLDPSEAKRRCPGREALDMAITGAHALLYTSEPEAVRAILRDVFGWHHVDSGGGWLIFALPPAELGVHPEDGPVADGGAHHQLSLMCDDLAATIAELRAKGIEFAGEPRDQGYGIVTHDGPSRGPPHRPLPAEAPDRELTASAGAPMGQGASPARTANPRHRHRQSTLVRPAARSHAS